MTDMGQMRVAWPDGGSVLDQPAVTVEVFAVISRLVREEAERK